MELAVLPLAVGRFAANSSPATKHAGLEKGTLVAQVP
jgi:hypothetical protein